MRRESLTKIERKHLEKYGRYISPNLFVGKGKITNLRIFEVLALDGKLTRWELTAKVLEKFYGEKPNYNQISKFYTTIFKRIKSLRKLEYVKECGFTISKGSEIPIYGLTEKGQSVANLISPNVRSNWFKMYENYSGARNRSTEGPVAFGQKYMQILVDSGISQNATWHIGDKPIRNLAMTGLINLDLISDDAFINERARIWANIWKKGLSCVLERKEPPSWWQHITSKDRKALAKAFNNPEFRRMNVELFQALRKQRQTEVATLKKIEKKLRD